MHWKPVNLCDTSINDCLRLSPVCEPLCTLGLHRYAALEIIVLADCQARFGCSPGGAFRARKDAVGKVGSGDERDFLMDRSGESADHALVRAGAKREIGCIIAGGGGGGLRGGRVYVYPDVVRPNGHEVAGYTNHSGQASPDIALSRARETWNRGGVFMSRRRRRRRRCCCCCRFLPSPSLADPARRPTPRQSIGC